MYCAFDSDCDGNKGVGFHPLVRKVLISGSYLVCLCEGLSGEPIMAVCEFYELDSVCGGWC